MFTSFTSGDADINFEEVRRLREDYVKTIISCIILVHILSDCISIYTFNKLFIQIA